MVGPFYRSAEGIVLVLVQGLRTNQAHEVGAQRLHAQIGVDTGEFPRARVGLVGQPGLHQSAHPFHEDPESLHEKVLL